MISFYKFSSLSELKDLHLQYSLPIYIKYSIIYKLISLVTVLSCEEYYNIQMGSKNNFTFSLLLQ